VLAVDELMAPDVGPRRVVVAMRLHAALMALRAGHLVIHLAYERKGYGAFEDLGLDEYVHHAWRLDERRVVDQVSALVGSADARDAYVERLAPRVAAARAARAVMVQALRDAARDRPAVVREPR
jgi:polysaccharide pyruvyl transferase WcaK-like protein